MNEVAQVILTAFVAIIGSSGMWAYFDHRRASRAEIRRQETEEEIAVRNAVKALVRMEIVRESLRLIEIGSISVEEADALSALYGPYEVLGGNGNGKRLYEQAVDLPRRTGRNAGRDS